MKWPTALLVGLLCLLYLRSPIDLLPERFGAVGLIDDLLVLIATAWWMWRRFAASARPAPGSRPVDSGGETVADPYAVLGVEPGASMEEVTRAYREQMKRYHPDRVADLGEELQQVAHRRSIEIQQAYAELTKR
jgi:DnaJ-domain-containing protein 1